MLEKERLILKVQVIEKKKGRINRITGEVIKGNLRVCAYARVSTDKEEQINSYNSQLKYYEEKIKTRSDWIYAGIYAEVTPYQRNEKKQ